jgi:YbbR domain-containing protein
MLFNVNISTNEKGNLIIEVPTGITEGMSKEEVHERLQELMRTPYAYTKDYALRDGSVNRYVHFSSISDRNRYHSLTVHGVEFKVKLDVVLTSKEVERHKPVTEEVNRYKELLEEGLIDKSAYDAIMTTLFKK